MAITKTILLATKLHKAGFYHPLKTVQEANRVGLDLASACAMLEKESAKGQNVFGSDGVRNPVKGGTVTKARYLLYKKYRQQGLGMQGVGPTQLTYYSFQDEADALGGCWEPRYNMRVGFKLLADLIKQHGHQEGAARYNGVGAAAEAYGRDFVAKRAKWLKYLS